MTLIAFAGDWHGDSQWAKKQLRALGAAGVRTLLHVGDFGIWPGASGRRFLLDVESTCQRFGVEVLVTPGNHEDWGRLVRLWDRSEGRDENGRPRPLQLTEHISVLPRGHRWEMEGRSFVSLGGAPSIDFISGGRTLGVNWWNEEMITAEDVRRTVDGGYAEVMVAHDAPDAPYQVEGVARIVAGNDFGWTDRELAYAAIGRARMHEAFLGVAPTLFVHGHYHVAGEASFTLPHRDRMTRIWALPNEGLAGNVRLLDLETLEAPAMPR